MQRTSGVGIAARSATLGRVRSVYVVLAIACAVAVWLKHGGAPGDWDYMREGSDLLLGHRTPLTLNGGAPLTGALSTSAGCLHLYAHYPSFQIGPLTFLVVALLRALAGTHGRLATQCLGMALFLPTVWLVESTAHRLRPATGRLSSRFVLVGGAALLLSWTQMTVVFCHLDDTLVMLAAAVAVRAVVWRQGRLLGLAVAVAIAAKPTGIMLLPLILTLPKRAMLRAAVVAALGIAAAWLPFVLADPATVRFLKPSIEVGQATALHVLGLHAHQNWVRPVQTALVLVASVAAVVRGRWPAVILVAAAARLLLDPGVWSYYAVGLVLGAFFLEATAARRPAGLFTLTVTAVFSVVPFDLALPWGVLTDLHFVGWLRLVSTSVVLLTVTATPRRFWPTAVAVDPATDDAAADDAADLTAAQPAEARENVR